MNNWQSVKPTGFEMGKIEKNIQEASQ